MLNLEQEPRPDRTVAKEIVPDQEFQIFDPEAQNYRRIGLGFDTFFYVVS